MEVKAASASTNSGDVTVTIASAEQVLEEWFGKIPVGMPDKDKEMAWERNYRLKWFATASRLSQVDTEIATRFGATLTQAEKQGLSMLDGTPGWSRSNPRHLVAFIVVLDQFSRHIYRTHADRDDKVIRNTRVAASATKLLLQAGVLGPCDLGALFDGGKPVAARQDFGFLPTPLFVFALMPLRHLRGIRNLSFVLAITRARAHREEKSATLLGKFQRAALTNLMHAETDRQSMAVSEAKDILAAEATYRSKARDVTHTDTHPAPKAEVSPTRRWRKRKRVAQDNVLMAAVDSFLAEQNGGQHKVVCVSLSGGVDSMVIAHILCHLRDKYKHKVVAIHIDYGNRAESKLEANFLKEWCSLHRISFELKEIVGVQRKNTKRAVYEQVTRDLRYGTYKRVLSQLDCPAVMFGHHHGDVQENVISNCMRGRSLLDIAGMTPTSSVNGVRVWRPLFHHTKKQVFEYAHAHEVPYFKDSTPSWSTRGHLRQQLVPLLRNMYGDGVMGNLTALAEESKAISEMMNAFVFEPFYAQIKRSPLCVWAPYLAFMDRPFYFWKTVLKKMCHSVGFRMPHNRAINQLMRQFQRHSTNHLSRKNTSSANGRKNALWISLLKHHPSMLADDNLFIFSPALMGSETAEPLSDNSALEIDTPTEEKSTVQAVFDWRPWRVTVTLTRAEERDFSPPTPVTAAHIASGKFSYTIPEATLPLRVVVSSKHPTKGSSADGGKRKRSKSTPVAARKQSLAVLPLAMRGLNVKLRHALPRLVCASRDKHYAARETVFARVSYDIISS